MSSSQPLRIAFVHPDLGIGGAERLIVDAAVSLQNCGHTVHIHTSHHDPTHCFDETRDGTLKIFTSGDWLPRTFLGRFYIIFAILRGIVLSLNLLMKWDSYTPLIRSGHPLYAENSAKIGGYDIIIADQLSIYNVFPIFTEAKTVFYCHFPDYKLSKRESNIIFNTIKNIYRAPINFVEQITTGMADTILVNSKFTQEVFLDSFPILKHRNIIPQIVYPSIQFSQYDDNKLYDNNVLEWYKWYVNIESLNISSLSLDNNNNNNNTANNMSQIHININNTLYDEDEPIVVDIDHKCDYIDIENISRNTCVYVSINRYERKKSIERAIYALSLTKQQFIPPEPPVALSPVAHHILSSDNDASDNDNDMQPISRYSKSSKSKFEHNPKHSQIKKNSKRSFSPQKSIPRYNSNGDLVFFPFNDVKLIIAGGYDPQNLENKEYYHELKQCAYDNGLNTSDYPDMSGHIVFIRSFTSTQRMALLRRAQAIVYTPSYEHFGIVPLEAMYGGRPVIASNTGGPKETIIPSVTGFLCDEPDETLLKHYNNYIKQYKYNNQYNKTLTNYIKEYNLYEHPYQNWANAFITILTQNNISLTLNNNARLRVKASFSVQKFALDWNKVVHNTFKPIITSSTSDLSSNITTEQSTNVNQQHSILSNDTSTIQNKYDILTYIYTKYIAFISLLLTFASLGLTKEYINSIIMILGATPRSRIIMLSNIVITLICSLLYGLTRSPHFF